jgi:hypothetical protein
MNRLKHTVLLLGMTARLLHADEYTFGDGFQVADSPLYLGGYLSSTYTSSKNADILDVDDIALLAYGEFDHIDFLAEFEAPDVYHKERGLRRDEHTNTTFHAERLYGDYFFGNNERLRVGKFYSDIGFWNQMPINVLRDTTSSPNLVKDFFPKLTTGLHYESRPCKGVLDRFSVTVQNNKDLDSGYNNFNFDRHYAAAADIRDQDGLWRFGGGYYRYGSAKEALYFLGAYKVETKGWKLLVESVLRRNSDDAWLSYDMYAQGVWHLRSRHDLILRGEIEKSPETKTRDGNLIVGYTYRPLNNVAVKSEYEAHQEASLNRALLSLSVLF